VSSDGHVGKLSVKFLRARAPVLAARYHHPVAGLIAGEIRSMPSTVNLYQIGVWFCVGFFTGAGWATAAWLVGRILRRF